MKVFQSKVLSILLDLDILGILVVPKHILVELMEDMVTGHNGIVHVELESKTLTNFDFQLIDLFNV